MSWTVSSAQPRDLYRYADVARHIDHELSSESRSLAATLHHFEATCREPGFALHVGYLADELHGYVRWVRPMDDWVREVGKGFERADRRSLLDIVWDWLRGLFESPISMESVWEGFDSRYAGRITVTPGPFHPVAIDILDALQVIPVDITQNRFMLLRKLFAEIDNAVNEVIANVEELLFITYLFSPRTNLFDILSRYGRMRTMLGNRLRKWLGNTWKNIFAYHSIYEGADWIKDAYLRLDPNTLGHSANMQDLAAVIEQMYRKWDDAPASGRNWVDDAIQIVQIGEKEWAVFIIGTDMDESKGINNPAANFYTGVGMPNAYQLYIQHLIEKTVPPDAKINFIGHSQGAYVVMNLADTQELADKYRVASVTTFAGDSLPDMNPNLDADIYHNYLIPDDAIMATRINLLGMRVETMPDEVGYSWNPKDRHTQYHLSQYLEGQPAPFEITRWESQFFTATDDDVREAGINPIPSTDIWNMKANAPFILGLTGAETMANVLYDLHFIPLESRTRLDALYDKWGEYLATHYVQDEMNNELDVYLTTHIHDIEDSVADSMAQFFRNIWHDED
jgi:pimeloyl-ACP methyl ester carboxylesterase